jgi:hypothetical protein
VKIDRLLSNEIKKANGDGTRATRFPFLNEIRDVINECSTTKVREAFPECLRRHSRASVAVAVALTICRRRDMLSYKSVMWAEAILKLWTNRPSTLDGMCFDDNLHPSRIEEYAGSFIKLTSEQD